MTTLPTINEPSFKKLFLSNRPLIDVRAPVEFQVGAFPEAVNLPLMNDAERHEVGKRYKANGQEAAISLGEKLVSGDIKEARIASWKTFSEKNPNAALYCYRGGLRSRTSQTWLHEVGVELPLIEGGYKALRRYLIDSLERTIPSIPMLVIGGRTGTGKTRVLHACERSIDLEGLANHRGSSFGATLTSQPSNIDFENRLAIKYLKLSSESTTRTVVLEDEARMIGRVALPQILREALAKAPIAILDVAFEERVQNVMEDYVVDLSTDYRARDGDKDGLNTFFLHHKNSVERLQKRLGGDSTRQVLGMLDTAYDALLTTGDVNGFRPYIAFLLNRYYDPMYDYQISAKQSRIRIQGDCATVIDWVAQTDLAVV